MAMVKPAFLSIIEFSPSKPVIVFVPSRRQCNLTAQDILTCCVAAGVEDRFRNAEESVLRPHLDHVTDPALRETLKHGIGYYHEAMDRQDQRIVQRLYESGAIQVLIASRVRPPPKKKCNNHLMLSFRNRLGAYPAALSWL